MNQDTWGRCGLQFKLSLSHFFPQYFKLLKVRSSQLTVLCTAQKDLALTIASKISFTTRLFIKEKGKQSLNFHNASTFQDQTTHMLKYLKKDPEKSTNRRKTHLQTLTRPVIY